MFCRAVCFTLLLVLFLTLVAWKMIDGDLLSTGEHLFPQTSHRANNRQWQTTTTTTPKKEVHRITFEGFTSEQQTSRKSYSAATEILSRRKAVSPGKAFHFISFLGWVWPHPHWKVLGWAGLVLLIGNPLQPISASKQNCATFSITATPKKMICSSTTITWNNI